jgi:LacI family transcriptional regulator
VEATSRVTIRDVADRAGVSVATVSKVINARYGVAASTVQRVQSVIDELGYEASLVARSLRNHRTNVIGILVSDIEPFSAELLKGAAKAIKGTGYELVIYSAGGTVGDHVGWERRYLSRLSGTLIDGAILVTPTVIAASFGSPVVAVDPHTGGEGVPTVDSDNLRGAQLAVEHLIGLGHRRIGFLAGRSDLESARLRELGYQRGLSEAGIERQPELTRVGSYEEGASQRAARELLTMPDRPTAVFAANDLSAITTVDVALTLGLTGSTGHRHACRAASRQQSRVDARDTSHAACGPAVLRRAFQLARSNLSGGDHRARSSPFTIAHPTGARVPAG